MIKLSVSLERRFVFYIGIGLSIFAFIASSITYYLSFQERITSTNLLLEQLGQTVCIQAAIAVFANNEKIAEDVVNSLFINPNIIAVTIHGDPDFQYNKSNIKLDTSIHEINLPLFSPENNNKIIGNLKIAYNTNLVKNEARSYALILSLWLLFQIILAALLLILIMRYFVSRPIHLLVETLVAIKPGDGTRLVFQKYHQHDEIGRLTSSVNQLLNTVDIALSEIREMAITDVLTNLPNRRHFMNQLYMEFERIQRFTNTTSSVVIFDMDHFKRVNDAYGHDAGDAWLSHLGLLIKQEIRQVDTPGRLGGEEFAIILPNTTIEGATIFAERLRVIVANSPIDYGKHTISLTLSIGITAISERDTHPTQCLKRADKALYQAKTSGRNKVIIHYYDP